jgi:hypothetical protein
VTIDRSRSLIVVAFRGTSGGLDLLRLIQVGGSMVSYSTICTGCMGSNGFLNAYLASKGRFQTALNAAVSANPNYTIVATGHSFGGSLANIAAADFRKTYPTRNVTFVS